MATGRGGHPVEADVGLAGRRESNRRSEITRPSLRIPSQAHGHADQDKNKSRSLGGQSEHARTAGISTAPYFGTALVFRRFVPT